MTAPEARVDAPGTGAYASVVRLASRLLPDTGDGRRLVVMSLVNATGSGLWMTGAALYFTKVVGVTADEVGLGLSLAGVVGLLTTMPIGALVDRFGPRRVYAGLMLWRAAGFLAYTFTRGFASFLAVACLLGAAERASGPVTASLVGAAVGSRERVRTMGYLMAARNAGFTVGGALASGAIGFLGTGSYGWLVLGNAASFVLAAPLALMIGEREHASAQGRLALLRTGLPRDARYLRLAAVNGLLVAHFTLISIVIPLWVVTRTGVPKAMLGVLFLVNTIGASAFQVRVSGRTDSLPAAARRFRDAGMALFVTCVAVAVTATVQVAVAATLLVCAVGLLTTAELTQSAAGWKVSFDLADDARRGSYLAAFSLGESMQSIVGPAALTFVVVSAGWGGWLVVAVLLLGGGLTGSRLTESASRRAGERSLVE